MSLTMRLWRAAGSSIWLMRLYLSISSVRCWSNVVWPKSVGALFEAALCNPAPAGPLDTGVRQLRRRLSGKSAI